MTEHILIMLSVAPLITSEKWNCLYGELYSWVCVGTPAVRAVWCTGAWFYFFLEVTSQHTDILELGSRYYLDWGRWKTCCYYPTLCSNPSSNRVAEVLAVSKGRLLFTARKRLVWDSLLNGPYLPTICYSKILPPLPPSCNVANSQIFLDIF